LNSSISFERMACTNSIMNRSAERQKHARARAGGGVGVADGVEQVRLALAGRALEVERRELRRFERGHALRGVDREHVGRAGNEFSEGQRGVEPDRASRRRR
jgi:hypothetical protein